MKTNNQIIKGNLLSIKEIVAEMEVENKELKRIEDRMEVYWNKMDSTPNYDHELLHKLDILWNKEYKKTVPIKERLEKLAREIRGYSEIFDAH